ncbi:MAG: hypothetical protein AW08_01259 [Candidatus Accumulibacter adjunctus]|uniref:Uncharacterized protein n=1 Tax=Candidatus Accumulibacter adjunctus TaxID=1454001 RepID=A0A011NVA2_9PROT|nr:MAG: hypothetical protein AW08_01259 [Candidatus Accumulibacter adjunctus]
MSVSAWLVTSLQLRPSGESLRHQIEVATTTPGRARSLTTARATNSPRRLKTRSSLPSAIARAAASAGLIRMLGDFSCARKRAELAKLVFRKLRAGGVSRASGKSCASGLRRHSRGSMKPGSGSSPRSASIWL